MYEAPHQHPSLWSTNRHGRCHSHRHMCRQCLLLASPVQLGPSHLILVHFHTTTQAQYINPCRSSTSVHVHTGATPTTLLMLPAHVGVTSWGPSHGSTHHCSTSTGDPPECTPLTTDQALETLKTKLTTAPLMAYPSFCKPFTIETEASIIGLGTVLQQI